MRECQLAARCIPEWEELNNRCWACSESMQQLKDKFAVAAQNGTALGYKRVEESQKPANDSWKAPVSLAEAHRRMKVGHVLCYVRSRPMHLFGLLTQYLQRRPHHYVNDIQSS